MPSLVRIALHVLLGIAVASSAAALRAEENLLHNGDFKAADAKRLPVGWKVWGPEVAAAACRIEAAQGGLRMDGPQEPFCVGGVCQRVDGVQGGKAYAIDALVAPQSIADPFRTVMVRLNWLKGKDSLHPAGWLVRGPVAAEGKLKFHDVYVAPKEADGAEVSLELKWPQGGSVTWQSVSLRPTNPPTPRKVKIGTVYLRPKGNTPEKNLELFCQQIDAAGKLGLDIVCLPEAITMVGTGKSGPQTAEAIPGPSTARLGEAAKKNRLWVVAGLYEKDGSRVYNTAVLVDREGKLAGKYRKTHLPREEWRVGVTPGQEYPVFQTDFGTVAIQICYDWFFPEVGTIWGLKGAEIVFAPTWGTTFPDQDGRAEGETVFRSRARDNGYYLVPSVYDGSSMVIDPMGKVRASNRGREGVFWCEVDLNEREPLPWVGHWRSIGPRDRMPGTYQPLQADPREPR
jgi:predicted amidohydrolase